MRQTIREIEVKVAYRWFIGYDLFEKIPHFSTFGKNYSRRFAGTDIFERVFLHILKETVKCGFVGASAIFIDGLVLTGRMASSLPAAGDGYAMDAILAVVIGGTPMHGGAPRLLAHCLALFKSELSII